MNFYNENDPFAAAWLRELIKADAIAPGIVDERSIEDIKPKELDEYTQCHFFAGIGVWSYALRQAGWPDDRKVWTGSCPCQPFSAAGKRGGTSDERHLWPSWFHLIQECHPDTIFGEQVEVAIREGWLDLVQDDLEGIGYACGAVPFPACSVGAPHIRKRLYFVADSADTRSLSGAHSGIHRGEESARSRDAKSERLRQVSVLEHAESKQVGLSGRTRKSRSTNEYTDRGQLGHSSNEGLSQRERNRRIQREKMESSARQAALGPSHRMGITDGEGPQPRNQTAAPDGQGNPSFTAGFWAECAWIPCVDGKTRPTKPLLFPLANGVTNRVGLLRGAGNALVAPQAQAFIESYLETQR